jgi:rare lipoprotein A
MQHEPARGRRIGAVALAACALGTGAVATATAQTQGPGVSMAVADGDRRVAYGEAVEVRGELSPASAGRTVTLQYAAEGGEFQPVAQTTTDGAGRYALATRPPSNGRLRAVADSGEESAPATVSVAAQPRVQARRYVRAGGNAVVGGRLLPGQAGRTVHLQVRRRRGWDTVDRARTASGGRYRAIWRPRAAGSYRLRVVFRGDRLNAAASRALRGRLDVFRPGHASWYGPGLYGNRMACGGTLTPGTLGVAHKWLPCGTRVTFRYRGRQVTVPVVDRGPFVAGREWDLTAATKHRLGFGSTGTVWTNR